jgi:virulence factor
MEKKQAMPTKGQIEPLRVGLIGVGNMGRHHARVLSLLKDVRFIGIADVNAEKGLEIASKYKAKFFESYRDLLPLVDAVCIAVPTRLHYEVGIACLAAGVHVLIEKPIAATITEAEELVNAAAENECILQVGHIERFNPVFQQLSNVLQAEQVLALEAHRMSPYSNRANDVSVVLDLMIHDIDLLMELADAPVVGLNASGSRSPDSKYLDYVTATLGFANGIVATLTASKVTHRKMRKITAHCGHSLTEANFLNSQIEIHRHHSEERSLRDRLVPLALGLGERTSHPYRLDATVEQVHVSSMEPLYAELEHFVNCVRCGNEPSVGGQQALEALQLATQIEQMALDGNVWTPKQPVLF